ncbi:Uncharacterised protein [Serratia quinivorans]|jgi:hypothetical protein|uniref:Uncharacterized protein n=1 Tax=Serratia quinivorans TaxID=137545 RepID=A0A379YNK9_9GAMM|nr:hypothetical protein [Serratia sp. BIGb0163]CAI0880411.1 Uncharacterised protein [Serratia quinivorans]CAI0971866.1 Uncharacterised protein [Serratia quinivorans]CAI1532050.1 Uncharacterised protein [Serratia quinivorans]CAI1547794.1 Uncharacterised protein [Serratia quinivorans]
MSRGSSILLQHGLVLTKGKLGLGGACAALED